MALAVSVHWGYRLKLQFSPECSTRFCHWWDYSRVGYATPGFPGYGAECLGIRLLVTQLMLLDCDVTRNEVHGKERVLAFYKISHSLLPHLPLFLFLSRGFFSLLAPHLLALNQHVDRKL